MDGYPELFLLDAGRCQEQVTFYERKMGDLDNSENNFTEYD